MRRSVAVLVALALAFGGLVVLPGAAASAESAAWHFYKGHSYLQTEPMTWAEAETEAVALGGHLVTVNDQAEQDWLEATFTDPELWIGFNDRAVEATWVWSSGEPVTYTNWSIGEPNDNEGAEDAAVMNWLHAGWPGPDPQPLGWNDLPEDGSLSGIVEVPGRVTNGAATPFKALYVGVTTWDCSGARVVNRVSVKDSETCLASGDTSGFVPGSYSGAPAGMLPPYGPNVLWLSDYDGTLASSWTIMIVDNWDGTLTAEIVAYY